MDVYGPAARGIRVVLLALVGALLSAPAHAAGYVKSVEYVEIAMAGGAATGSANLTKSQIVANCVPFASALMTGTGFRRMLTDVSLTAGAPPTVNVARDQSGGGATVTVGVYVVEFDPTYVKVQQGTFTLANGSGGAGQRRPDGRELPHAGGARVLPPARHQRRTSPTSRSRGRSPRPATCSSSGRGRAEPRRGTGTSSRRSPSRGLYAFTVQPMTFTFAAASGTSAALTPSVPASTTFLTGSYRTADASDQPDGGADRLELTGCAGSPSLCTSITAQSYNGTSSVTVTAFAITFASGIRVQRGTLSYGAAATQATATLASPVNTGVSMAWNGFGSGPGVMKSDVGTASLPATALPAGEADQPPHRAGRPRRHQRHRRGQLRGGRMAAVAGDAADADPVGHVHRQRRRQPADLRGLPAGRGDRRPRGPQLPQSQRRGGDPHLDDGGRPLEEHGRERRRHRARRQPRPIARPDGIHRRHRQQRQPERHRLPLGGLQGGVGAAQGGDVRRHGGGPEHHRRRLRPGLSAVRLGRRAQRRGEVGLHARELLRGLHRTRVHGRDPGRPDRRLPRRDERHREQQRHDVPLRRLGAGRGARGGGQLHR